MDNEQIIIKESNHWYDYQGTPVSHVPRKDPLYEGLCPKCRNPIATTSKIHTCKRCKVKIDVSSYELNTLRETTLRDAKHFGLFKSISKMATYGESPFEFTAWVTRRLVMASVKATKKYYGQSDEVIFANVNRAIQEAKEEYANLGTDGHAAIQLAMEGMPYEGDNPVYLRCIDEIQAWEISMGVTGPIRETPHCDPIKLGLGGCIDFTCESPRIINDYKFKFQTDPNSKAKSTFDKIKGGARGILKSAIKQIAGYGGISVWPDRAFITVIRGDVWHPDAGETLFIELTKDELAWGIRTMQKNVEAFYEDARWDPRIMFHKGLCKTRAQIMEGIEDVRTGKHDCLIEIRD